MTHRQVVIEAGELLQIALICPSANLINHKYRMNGEVEEYSCIPEDGQNPCLKVCCKPGNILSIHLLTAEKKKIIRFVH